MREIKFRIWDEHNKTWLSDNLFDINCRFGTVHQHGNSGTIGGVIIEQYTGLEDKTGKAIYEGDIIKVFDRYNEVWSTNGAEVIFSIDYVGGWVISNGKENLTLGKRQNSLRIIGNIHESPKLLAP